MSDTKVRLILGPQRPHIYVGDAMQRYQLNEEPVAVISAGWREAEGDIDDLREKIGQPLVDLGLYARSNELFAAEPELHAAYRERQERLAEQQRMYRLRLKQLKMAVRQTLRAEGSPAVIAPERRHAISQLRALDRHHQRQIDNAHKRFDNAFNTNTNAALAAHTRAVHAKLEGINTVVITGGNLLVLINRFRLFGVADMLANKHVVAWSAGAMLLGDRIVLFHDRLPQGTRDAEIIDRGLGLLPQFIVLPDAKNRLRQRNKLRMSSLSRRFAPSTCGMLNNGSMAMFEDGELRASEAVFYPTLNGNIKPVINK